MPVKLTQLNGNFGYVLATGQPLPYGDATTLMFDVINLWSQIDMNVGLLIAKVVGSDPAAATAMYQATSGAEQKAKVLRAAMSIRSTQIIQALVAATLGACQSSKKERNAFAHDLWGYINPLDGRLVSMQPSDYSRFSARSNGAGVQDIEQARQELAEQTSVWTIDDLVVASERARTCHGLVARFSFLIDHPAAQMMQSNLLLNEEVNAQLVRRLRQWSTQELEQALAGYGNQQENLVYGALTQELQRRAA